MKSSTPKKTHSPTESTYHVNLKVIGVGGGGGNAVSRMRDTTDLKGIEYIAINTDMQDLEHCSAKKKIHIGKNLTRGLGTGMNPELGKQAAEENRSEIVDATKGADLVFITAGLGGGTGSGAAPIVAEIAREQGALVIAVITKPFTFEGSQRMRIAEEALGRLRERVDAIIVVPNDRVFNVIKKDTPLMKAFERIDDILHDAIGGISELIASAGIINVDFADVKSIMKDAGPALVGVGASAGATRATIAAGQAINSPLLEFSVEGARGLLFGVSGGRDLKMSEINEIAKIITSSADPSAKVIFGAYHDRRLKKGAIKVTLIATGFSGSPMRSSESMNFGSNLFTSAPVEEPTGTPLPLKAGKDGEVKLSKKITVEEKKNVQEEKKKSDTWEIPAFLRKKRR